MMKKQLQPEITIIGGAIKIKIEMDGHYIVCAMKISIHQQANRRRGKKTDT